MFWKAKYDQESLCSNQKQETEPNVAETLIKEEVLRFNYHCDTERRPVNSSPRYFRVGGERELTRLQCMPSAVHNL